MKKGYIAVLLDETGSMYGEEKRVITGINEYISKLKAKAQNDAVSYEVVLNLFDSERWREYYQGPLNQFPMMEKKDYYPGACTPLYDSIYKMIRNIESKSKDAKVLVLIDTDGLENASREVGQKKIFKKIKEKESKGWTFVFLGAELKAFGGARMAQQKMGLGIPDNNCLDFRNEERSMAYHRAAEATSSLMTDVSKDSDDAFWERA